MFLSFPVHWFWDIAFWFKWDPALCINSLQLRVLWWSMEKYRAECRRVVPAVFSRLGGHLSPPRSRDLVASWDCSVWLEFTLSWSPQVWTVVWANCPMAGVSSSLTQSPPPLICTDSVQGPSLPWEGTLERVGREHPASFSCRILRGRDPRVVSSSGPVSIHISWALPVLEQPRDTSKARAVCFRCSLSTQVWVGSISAPELLVWRWFCKWGGKKRNVVYFNCYFCSSMMNL